MDGVDLRRGVERRAPSGLCRHDLTVVEVAAFVALELLVDVSPDAVPGHARRLLDAAELVPGSDEATSSGRMPVVVCGWVELAQGFDDGRSCLDEDLVLELHLG